MSHSSSSFPCSIITNMKKTHTHTHIINTATEIALSVNSLDYIIFLCEMLIVWAHMCWLFDVCLFIYDIWHYFMAWNNISPYLPICECECVYMVYCMYRYLMGCRNEVAA